MNNQMASSFDSRVRNGIISPVIQRGPTNKRTRDCHRCGGDCPKDTGTQIVYWSNGRKVESYLCAGCATAFEAISTEGVVAE